jgi:predicted secreted hydrolase
MKKSLILTIFLFSLGLALVIWLSGRKNERNYAVDFLELPTVPQGFERADGSRELVFPEDFGPHPAYQTEWWYYTGNLQSVEGHRFGYQLTFFRRGLQPPQDWAPRQSSWAANQVYMAHLALSDITAEEHQAFERFSRGAVELAGAQADPFRVWLEDWQVIQTGTNGYKLVASQGTIRLDLVLTDSKGPIFHGDHGYSQKGSDPGSASYYFSQTRLVSSGLVQVGEIAYQVQGLSWMDHEFSTSALSPGQVGWDWFSIQLEEGTDLMVFQIRDQDGGIDPFSSGTLVSPDGETLGLSRDDFQIVVEDTWRSPRTGAVYPARWRLLIPSQDLELEIEPFLADQEMDLSYAYWEGAVQVSGIKDDGPVSGAGYIEMTGYAQSLEGEF